MRKIARYIFLKFIEIFVKIFFKKKQKIFLTCMKLRKLAALWEMWQALLQQRG